MRSETSPHCQLIQFSSTSTIPPPPQLPQARQSHAPGTTHGQDAAPAPSTPQRGKFSLTRAVLAFKSQLKQTSSSLIYIPGSSPRFSGTLVIVALKTASFLMAAACWNMSVCKQREACALNLVFPALYILYVNMPDVPSIYSQP